MNLDPNNESKNSQVLQNLMMQLRKTCNHPYLFFNYDTSNITDEIWRSSGKFELLDRMIPKLLKTKHRILIFT
jgi:SNF2 family DNA or RNA helicase